MFIDGDKPSPPIFDVALGKTYRLDWELKFIRQLVVVAFIKFSDSFSSNTDWILDVSTLETICDSGHISRHLCNRLY